MSRFCKLYFCLLLLVAATTQAAQLPSTPNNPKIYALTKKQVKLLSGERLGCYHLAARNRNILTRIKRGDLKDGQFTIKQIKAVEIRQLLARQILSNKIAPSPQKKFEIAFYKRLAELLVECRNWTGPETEPTPTPQATNTPNGNVSEIDPTPTPGQSFARAPTSVVTSLTFDDITVHFDRPVTIAYYTTGEPAALAPFVITSVDPAPIDLTSKGQSGRLTPANGMPHGCIQDETFWNTHCNELDRTLYDAKCGPDSSACYYDRRRHLSLLNPIPHQVQNVTSRAGGAPGTGLAYPHFFNSALTESLLLTRSVADTRECTPQGTSVAGYYDFRGGCNWSGVRSAFILTIVPSAEYLPYVDEVRPPYPRMVPASTAKPRIFLRNLDINYLSLALTPVPSMAPYPTALRGVEKTWLVDAAAEGYTRTSPNQNMRSYGTGISMELGDAMLWLVSSGVSLQQKIDIAKHLVQIGFDAYYAAEAGKAYVSNWPGYIGANGHAGYGQISTIVLAGALMQQPNLRNYVLQGSNKFLFRKTCGPIYDAPGNPKYMQINDFPRYNSGYACTGWPSGPWDRETPANYYFCCGPTAWLGEFLVLRLLGLETEFSNSAIFDLLDRVYNEGYIPGAHFSQGAMASWAAYSNLPNLCANGVQNKCHPGWCNSLSGPPYTPAESAIDVGPAC